VFNNNIQVNGLREITIGGGKYTWSNNQTNPILEKLDMVLMSREWELLFPTVVLVMEIILKLILPYGGGGGRGSSD
jgi:hypothetical protein